MKRQIQAYTIDAAYAAFEEKLKESIEVGKLADLIVLSEDIFSIELTDIPKTEVVVNFPQCFF